MRSARGMKRFLLHITALLLGVLLLPGAPVAADKQRDFGSALEAAEKAYAAVNDYTSVIRKKVVVKGTLKEERNTIYKFMKPGSFYLKWTEGKRAGTEVIYVEGANNNKIRAHTGGMLSFMNTSLDPKGSLAMKDNLHPIYDSGFGFMLKVLRNDYNRHLKNRDAVITYEGLSDDGREIYKGVFPAAKGYYGHIVVVYIAEDTRIPTGIAVYGWNDEFIEEYHFEKVKLNAGLTAFDFDPKNPAYGY